MSKDWKAKKFKRFGSKKPKGPEQGSQKWPRSPTSEEEEEPWF